MSEKLYTAGRQQRCPSHPGAILLYDVLPALGITKTAMAKELGISRQMLHNILTSKAPITPDMAVRIGKFCGNGPSLWLRMQVAHDLWHSERKLAKEIAAIPCRQLTMAG